MNTVFSIEDAGRAWVTAFAGDPKDARGAWAGGEAGRHPEYWKDAGHLNTFFCISTFRQGEKGEEIGRRGELHEATHVIVVDDVGELGATGIVASMDELKTRWGIEPSYAIETSPGNCHVGLLLKEPDSRDWAVLQVQRGIIEKLCRGKDPGMGDVTRYVRLPEGVNGKAKQVKANGGKPWRHRVTVWEPERRYTLEEIAEAFGFELDATGTSNRARGSAPLVDEKDLPECEVFDAVQEAGLIKFPIPGKTGVHDMRCPWVHEHGSGIDDGAAFFRKGSTASASEPRKIPGFRCHHGGCNTVDPDTGEEKRRTIRDVIRWLREEHGLLKGWSSKEVFASLDLTHDGRRDHDETQDDLSCFPLGHPREQADMYLEARCKRDGELLLRYNRDQFYRYQGGCYQGVELPALNESIGAWAERFETWPKPTKANPEPEPTRVRVNQSLISEIRGMLAGKTLISERTEQPAWLAPLSGVDPPAVECVPCQNGILHAPTRVLLPPTARFWSVNALEYDFDRSATCPEFESFIDSIFEDDQDGSSKLALQEMFGYLVSQDTRQQKLFFVVGPRRSGKGTLARVLFDLIGQYNCAAPTLDSLVDRFGLSHLIGKQLAVVSDAQFGGGKDQTKITEQLKRISGEDSVTADRKNVSAWTGRLPVRFLIMSNSLPMLNDASGALAGRVILFVLTKSFYKEEDLGLYERLRNELPGILNWALEGYARLIKQGCFTEPTKSCAAMKRLYDITSPVSAFVEDHLEIGADFEVKVADVYQVWKHYCESNGRRHPSSSNHFSADLTSAFPRIESRRVRRDGDRSYYFFGVQLRGSRDPFGDLKDYVSDGDTKT